MRSSILLNVCGRIAKRWQLNHPLVVCCMTDQFLSWFWITMAQTHTPVAPNNSHQQCSKRSHAARSQSVLGRRCQWPVGERRLVVRICRPTFAAYLATSPACRGAAVCASLHAPRWSWPLLWVCVYSAGRWVPAVESISPFLLRSLEFADIFWRILDTLDCCMVFLLCSFCLTSDMLFNNTLELWHKN